MNDADNQRHELYASPQRSRVSLISLVLPSSSAKVLFVLGSGLAIMLYTILLPFGSTQRFELHNWHYLTPLMLGLAVAYGLGLAWIIACQVSAVRQVAVNQGRNVGVIGAVVGLLPSMLCCTPIVPTVVSAFGASGVALLTTSGHIQGFFATHEKWIELGGLGILVLSGFWSTHKLRSALCLTGTCDLEVARDGPSDGAVIGEPGSSNQTEKLANNSNSGGNVR